MSATFDPRRETEPPTSGSQGMPLISDPSETDRAGMGLQVGLWDAAGIAAMTSGRIPRLVKPRRP